MNPHNFRTMALVRHDSDTGEAYVDSVLCAPWPTQEEIDLWRATVTLRNPDVNPLTPEATKAMLLELGYPDALRLCETANHMQMRARHNLCHEIILNTPIPIGDEEVLAYYHENRRRRP